MTKYILCPTSKFKCDLRLMEKQAKDLTKLNRVLNKLCHGKPLPPECRTHFLKGFPSYQKLHLGYDWLLIFKRSGHKIYLLRTGSHAMLF